MGKELSYQNPILPGFYPDPSIIRVKDVFYMANSSFQFFPGLPIHKSTNLVQWELIGNAICRPTQIDLTLAVTKINRAEFGEFFTAGIYAPTIRYHDGIFYIVSTNLTGREEMPSTEDFAPKNFIITSSNLEDPTSFSDPIYFDFWGIDPSLFFDDDGKVYMQGSWIHGYRKKPATVIRQAQIDLSTGELLSEVKDIWAGSGDKCPEGPHLYKKDGRYWLLIAEGGTHRDHKITMARSKNVWGPYESYEHNPVLTNQGQDHPIQCVGHGELVSDTEGEWWCTLLARRQHGDAYPLGRETYLVPVSWPHGEFPSFESVQLKQVVGSGDRKLPEQLLSGSPNSVTKVFQLDSPHTVWLRTPDIGSSIHELEPSKLILKATPTALGCTEGSPTFVGQRQVSLEGGAHVLLDLGSLPVKGHCGLSLYKDSYRHASLDVDSDRRICLAVAHKTQSFTFLNGQSIASASTVKLVIRAAVDNYEFSYTLKQDGYWQNKQQLGSVSAAAFSGDDFTGE
ncbi:hypothetical protein ACHAPT_012803 [Fusarium lateritium]